MLYEYQKWGQIENFNEFFAGPCILLPYSGGEERSLKNCIFNNALKCCVWLWLHVCVCVFICVWLCVYLVSKGVYTVHMCAYIYVSVSVLYLYVTQK